MILYFLKSSVLLFVFCVIYKVCLERKKNLQFNRYFLLLSLCFGLLFPLMNVQFTLDTPVLIETKQLVLEQLPALEITSIQKQTDLNFNYLKIVYLIITSFFTVKFLTNLFYFV